VTRAGRSPSDARVRGAPDAAHGATSREDDTGTAAGRGAGLAARRATPEAWQDPLAGAANDDPLPRTSMEKQKRSPSGPLLLTPPRVMRCVKA